MFTENDGVFITDLEKFVELYKSFGVDVKVFNLDDEFDRIILSTESTKNDTNSEKFEGYCGFFTNIDFDKSGKFVKQGFWE